MSANTLFDKVWDHHAVRTLPSGQTQLFIGLHLIHEVTSPQAFAMLRERKLMCERLPFARPYHTPLFAPALGSLDGMFDDVLFRRPNIPVYSCTTARPFPAEPAGIRELTVAHWAAPVRFTEIPEHRREADQGIEQDRIAEGILPAERDLVPPVGACSTATGDARPERAFDQSVSVDVERARLIDEGADGVCLTGEPATVRVGAQEDGDAQQDRRSGHDVLVLEAELAVAGRPRAVARGSVQVAIDGVAHERERPVLLMLSHRERTSLAGEARLRVIHPRGLEPLTFWSVARCSIQLS